MKINYILILSRVFTLNFCMDDEKLNGKNDDIGIHKFEVKES